MRNQLVKWILTPSQYAYDFLAAPILGAAVALLADYSSEFGSCVYSSFSAKTLICLIPSMLRFTGIISMFIAGVMLWKLGSLSRVIQDQILKVENEIEKSRDQSHLDEIDARKDHAASEMLNSKATIVLITVFSVIVCILFSGVLLFIEGVCSGIVFPTSN